jgi:hypothetical protein
MALVPALAAAALTLALGGMGRHGAGIGLAVAIALLTFCVIALPIDRFGSRARHRTGTRSVGRSSGRRRK